MASFYLIVAPGLEVQCLQEIKEVWPYLIGKDGQPHATTQPEFAIDRGGIEFTVEEILAYQLNFFLKTPTRLLQRLKQFRVRDFPKVFQEASKVQWAQYLQKDLPVALSVSAQRSRLNNEKRLASVLTEVLAKQGLRVTEEEASQTIYLRMDDDQCSLSIDASGEMLYRRGWGIKKGEAPLRETLAAFCLRETIGSTPLPQLRKIELVDPFCGSGTFLSEAAALFAPHWERDFAFMRFPQVPKIFQSPSWKKNFKLLPMPVFASYYGNEVDAKTLSIAQENLRGQSEFLKGLSAGTGWEPQVQWGQKACEEMILPAVAGERWLVSNPPYGGRVGLQGRGDLAEQLGNVLKQGLFTRIGLLLPTSEAQALNFEGYEKTQEIPLSNGGLKTLWTVWCKKS